MIEESPARGNRRSIVAFDKIQVEDRPPDDRPEPGIRLGQGAGEDESGDVAGLADAFFLEVWDDLDQCRSGLGVGQGQWRRDGVAVDVLVFGRESESP